MGNGHVWSVDTQLLDYGFEMGRDSVRRLNVKDRNRIKMQTPGRDVSHFSMHEFENPDGLVMVHPTVLEGLERVRAELNRLHGGGIAVLICDSVRTQADLAALAAKYGWVDEGGTVSRDSRHLAKYGGIAVDIIAVDTAERNERVLQDELGAVARHHFDWVKDDYRDGHVHADQRDGGKKLRGKLWTF